MKNRLVFFGLLIGMFLTGLVGLVAMEPDPYDQANRACAKAGLEFRTFFVSEIPDESKPGCVGSEGERVDIPWELVE